MSYGHDLADIHHRGFGEFAESAAPGVLALLAKHGIRSGLVVEAGCGSGILARALIQAGFQVAGYDASPSMIALARATAPEARFEMATFDSMEIPSCAAIVAMGEVLNHGTSREMQAFLEKAAHALATGGVLLFDVAERDADPPHEERRMGGEDWSVILINDRDGHHLTRRVLTFRNVEGVIHRDEEVHSLQLFDRAEVLEPLRTLGFRVKVRRSYGTRRHPKGSTVYVAVRHRTGSGDPAE